MFSWQMGLDSATNTYQFYWHEVTSTEIQTMVNRGYFVAFSDGNLTGEPVKIVEYFNTDLKHYYLVQEGDESVAIDAGAAGAGWVRTGQAFMARKVNGYPITASVCRFYGSVSPGPNSHFFTAEPDECSAVKNIAAATPPDQPRWNYEGLQFNAFRTVNGACPAGKIPVWRAFNGGPAKGLESNHRFSTDKTAIDSMVAGGWIAEGIAFCTD